MTKLSEVEATLAHYGVVGMKWGKRKAETPSERQLSSARKELASIERKRTSSIPRRVLSADAVLAGAGARAGAAKRIMKLEEVTAADGVSKRLVATSKTPVTTKENAEQYERKISRAAYTKYVASGTVAVGTILAAGVMAQKYTSPATAKQVAIGSVFMAGAQALKTANVVGGIHRNDVDRRLALRERQLKSDIYRLEKETKA